MEKHLIPVYEDDQIVEFADTQLSVFWTHHEIKVEKDIQDILVNFTEAEKHAVIETLRLFSIYETHVGDEWWGGRFKKMFPRADYHRMASVFAMFENSVHAPFYNMINDLLHINTPEFYTSYIEDSTLRDRMGHIGKMIDDPSDEVALGSFCMVEGVILYSNFAFLKHYQSQGKNKLMNVVRGLNFSVRDEQLHATASAYAFKQKMKDRTEEEKEVIYNKLVETSNLILEHETKIIEKLFEKGKIDGITDTQLVNFVKSRINTCFQDMGFKKLHNVTYNPVAQWFYQGINNYQFNDFFSGAGASYHRNWDESAFEW